MLARHYAAEGLSIGRTAPLIGRTRAELGAAASRYKIRFSGEYGAPFGNSNRLGKRTVTDEVRRQRHREAAARHRARKRAGTVRKRPPEYLRKERRYRRVSRLAKWKESADD
jgi:hypothetical protein